MTEGERALVAEAEADATDGRAKPGTSRPTCPECGGSLVKADNRGARRDEHGRRWRCYDAAAHGHPKNSWMTYDQGEITGLDF